MTTTPMAQWNHRLFGSFDWKENRLIECPPWFCRKTVGSVITSCLILFSVSMVAAQQGWTPPPTESSPSPSKAVNSPSTAPVAPANQDPSTGPQLTTLPTTTPDNAATPTPATGDSNPSTPAPVVMPTADEGKTNVSGAPPKTTPFRPSFSQPKQGLDTGGTGNGFSAVSPTSDSGTSPSSLPSISSSGFAPPASRFSPGPTTGGQNSGGAGQGFAAPSSSSAAPRNASPTAAANLLSQAKQDSSQAGQTITKVSKSFSRLPSTAGQVWREYDITPYTSRITAVEDPQQAIIDWILLETGTDMWFHQPLGILSANRHKLFVYHTPELQAVVSRIVDRMVNTRGQLQSISVNLLTIANPNWRSEAYSVMQPIDVRSPGVEAWMVSKENAAYLLSNMRRRADFEEHGNARLVQHDGQTIKVEKYKPVQFVQNIRWTPNQVPGYQPQLKTIEEGYALKLATLTSLDGKTIEATVECSVDQVEKLRSVKIAIPSAENTNGAQVNLQIPQMVSWEIQERFRWPNDQVLVLSCGVVANPKPKSNNLLIPDLFEVDRGRADALLFIEYRGPEVAQLNTQPQPAGLSPVRRRQ
ncbi:MAG: hypothetical protein VYE64_08685 [Planctomycetota bacterium]|nr:hypothetical protein [Planctomycetota bacterium]